MRNKDFNQVIQELVFLIISSFGVQVWLWLTFLFAVIPPDTSGFGYYTTWGFYWCLGVASAASTGYFFSSLIFRNKR